MTAESEQSREKNKKQQEKIPIKIANLRQNPFFFKCLWEHLWDVHVVRVFWELRTCFRSMILLNILKNIKI